MNANCNFKNISLKVLIIYLIYYIIYHIYVVPNQPLEEIKQ